MTPPRDDLWAEFFDGEAFLLTPRLTRVSRRWYQATIDELPAVITCGRTLEDAMTNLEDTLAEWVLANVGWRPAVTVDQWPERENSDAP